MKGLLSAVVAIGSLAIALGAFAQTSAPAPAPNTTPVVQTNSAPAMPVAPSKRFACRTTAQGLQGQERKDQMQLCLAQAHLDCLKQAIDQKVVGPQRREFVRTCVDE
jgi:hypothetical protein